MPRSPRPDPTPTASLTLRVPADLVQIAADRRASANSEEALRPELSRVLLAALRAGLGRGGRGTKAA